MMSQAEIDALLSGSLEAEQRNEDEGVNLAELRGDAAQPAGVRGKPAQKQVRPYNFWSPERFSKDQMRAVELVHENLAERLTSSMPSYLRTDFRPRVVHSEQGRSDEFFKDLPQGTLFHMLALDPLPGRMLLVIGQEIVWVLLDRLLGGAGVAPSETRVLTDIGQSLIKGMVEHMLNDIKAAWSKVVQLEPRLEDSTVNHHWVQMMMGNSRVMSITFEVTILEQTGTMSVYIPFSTLKPVAQVLNPHVWIAGPDDHRLDAGLRQRNLTAIKQVTVPFRVFLGGAELPLGDLMNLQPGDVICLETPVRQELPVWVADAPRFRCRPGTVGRRLAVQISQVIPPESAS